MYVKSVVVIGSTMHGVPVVSHVSLAYDCIQKLVALLQAKIERLV